MLGYETVEDWIINQPKSVLFIEKKTGLVYPPRIGEMPSSSDSEDDDSDEDDEEESGSSSGEE